MQHPPEMSALKRKVGLHKVLTKSVDCAEDRKLRERKSFAN